MTPVTLEGDHVRLVPLTLDHVDALWAVGQDPALWTWGTASVASRGDMERYVRSALAAQDAGTALPFATLHKESRTAVGSTRFGNADPRHRRVEIGWTWVAPPWQRTAVNTEAKLLMLRHAFGSLGCERVEFKADALNERSRRALLRLGATEEGTLRRHMTTASGRVRDTVYFSVVRDEWPRVEARLLAKLDR